MITGVKVSVYLPIEVREELEAEMLRQDRSASWLLRRAWALARKRILRFPNKPEILRGAGEERR